MAANATDEGQIARKRNRSKTDEETANLVLRTLMNTVEGRRYIWIQLGQMHVFHSTFTGDALTSAFREGERTCGLRLWHQIELACPRQLLTMTIENSAIELKETANGGSNNDDSPSDNNDGASVN